MGQAADDSEVSTSPITSPLLLTRRQALATAAGVLASLAIRPGSAQAKQSEYEAATVGKITKSGVKYFDAAEGSGDKIQWGKMCSIKFTLYGRPAQEGRLQRLDSSDNNGEPFLFKHGNGRQIKGLEEGMHTMRVGGKRRIIIPPTLGYTVSGLGPFPAGALSRMALDKMLDSLGTNGQLVMDVELLDAFDDEADLGYYTDSSLNLEEMQDVMRVTDLLLDGKAKLQALPGQSPTEQF
ncbi:hypothetical protein JKP88DRAFT_199885 [Tribonema minus]|uniref:peptidylprolyl isomerase n=1 Tax=Tribonema minus TaxID=303371 RepID=A0A835YXX3_9STRA|nr:hypothetical protein JKP88DRAFT_199885 [Tribonema minus]